MRSHPAPSVPDSAAYPPEVEAFRAGYPFPLDEFQLTAAAAIAAGRGVLVGAPTGAGKTVVGEFAVHAAFHSGGTCFYTTPIKALSNQKYRDLVERYGQLNVGLLTGDVTINGDAPIVVMTTEVLRNMIYADSERLRTLTHVVMDEVHFLADPSRGPVWEEAILNLDPRVILVSLSATVSNVEEFGGWLRTVRGKTDIVITERRPVPLRQFVMVGSRILPMFSKAAQNPADQHVGAVNRQVLLAAQRAEELGRRKGPKRTEVVGNMLEAGMLPAIYFIFSRVGCDTAVRQLLVDRVDLVTEAEREEICSIVDAGVGALSQQDLKVLGFSHFRRALSRGFAAHHAGMLPAFRHIVEQLFSRGLLKVCFATETLALGINMPARSVVLEKLVKFNGEAHVDLTPGQYTQLTGRAGRRGIDVVGNAVVLWSQGIDIHAVADLASTRTYPLDSTFRPGYNMAVNLIATKGLEQSHRLLERSFAQYQSNGAVVERAELTQKRRLDLREQRRALEQLVQGSTEDFQAVVEYAGLRRKLAHEERRAKREALEDRQVEVAALLRSLAVGDIIALPTGRNPMTAVVARADGDPRNPRPTIITEDGWAERVAPDMFGNTPVVVGHMRLHRGVERNPKRQARPVAANLRRMHVDKPAKLKPRARGGSSASGELRSVVQAHPVHSWPQREELCRAGELYLKAERRLEFHQRESADTGHTLVGTFDRILALLAELDYVQMGTSPSGDPTAEVTMEGERLARVHHESDLLVAQCLRRGVWDGLDPAELAGVVSTCVFENRRETGGELHPPTDALEEAINQTLRIHEELRRDEERHRLTETREPVLSFATAAHQWTAGAPLEYCLQAAEASGAQLTPGDFVRWCRRVMDLLDQIKQTGYSDEVRAAARKAVAAMKRGVVAIDA
ncbi:DEAD/DEAH box helicase [Corynebacterium heidelbergense]|uniref:DEAD/DEAH box helicase n=1 Tax=Corynebacterium heidelbergense TaxID=2055947 RepID=A0A364V505_9CORY|nr:DEAD/DEAH box helicase [Corynebacterium heidelbergense]RAV31696.1 DEAD/DEAH box helicase [Corynebacterium heidelbergense]